MDRTKLIELLGGILGARRRSPKNSLFWQSPAAEFELLLPVLASSQDADQRQLVRLLAEAATGAASELVSYRSQALRLLHRFTFPWPDDYRMLLRDGAKEVLLRYFQSLETPQAPDHMKLADAEAKRSWGFTVTLYSVLLGVSTDEELEASITKLLSQPLDPSLRQRLRRAPRIAAGRRLGLGKQMTKAEYERYYVSLHAEFRRDKDHDQE